MARATPSGRMNQTKLAVLDKPMVVTTSRWVHDDTEYGAIGTPMVAVGCHCASLVGWSSDQHLSSAREPSHLQLHRQIRHLQRFLLRPFA
jgi:hypothetical protein